MVRLWIFMFALFSLLQFSGIAQGATTYAKGGKDANHNGIPDSWEHKYHLKGTGKVIASADNDKDGLNNLQEYKIGDNPKNQDSDHDGIKDGAEDFDNDGLNNEEEFKYGYNVKEADSDHDGIRDGLEDYDKDGIDNEQEYENGYDWDDESENDEIHDSGINRNDDKGIESNEEED